MGSILVKGDITDIVSFGFNRTMLSADFQRVALVGLCADNSLHHPGDWELDYAIEPAATGTPDLETQALRDSEALQHLKEALVESWQGLPPEHRARMRLLLLKDVVQGSIVHPVCGPTTVTPTPPGGIVSASIVASSLASAITPYWSLVTHPAG